MLAAYAHTACPDSPLDALTVGEIDQPRVPDGWVRVKVSAASLNHHDVWSLRGVGLPSDRLPMILGCDAVGTTDDGDRVLVHSVISSDTWSGDETLDPKRSLLSELYPGTLAEYVHVPARNIVPCSPELSDAEASCLPTAWLTAYKMLFDVGGVKPGQTILVQGVGGGVASALITLASSAGVRVWATTRHESKHELGEELGADLVVPTGERLPGRVDAVMETVGEATWKHSIKCLKPGGTLVVSGATSGTVASTELNRVFFLQLNVRGATMGTTQQMRDLQQFCLEQGISPRIDSTFELSDARSAFSRMIDGSELAGKIVLTP